MSGTFVYSRGGQRPTLTSKGDAVHGLVFLFLGVFLVGAMGLFGLIDRLIEVARAWHAGRESASLMASFVSPALGAIWLGSAVIFAWLFNARCYRTDFDLAFEIVTFETSFRFSRRSRTFPFSRIRGVTMKSISTEDGECFEIVLKTGIWQRVVIAKLETRQEAEELANEIAEDTSLRRLANIG
jgi:hypothetical protein